MSLTELEDVPLLLPPKGAALRRVLDRAAGSVDVTLRAQAEIDGVRLLASLAFDGYGASIVPATARIPPNAASGSPSSAASTAFPQVGATAAPLLALPMQYVAMSQRRNFIVS